MDEHAVPRDRSIAEQLNRITSAAKALPAKDRLGFMKGALLSISDPAIRQAVEDILITYATSEDSRRRHVVALIHGIRTRAIWFEPLGAMLAEIPGVTVKPLPYGRFDSFRFLVPFLRSGPIRHLKAQLALIARENEDAHVSVIAHSFGTHAVCKLLQQEAGLRLFRVIFCGSIVKPRFEWHRIAGLVEKRPVINECGARDAWPLIATNSTWGYGPSGTYGFEHTFVMNRFHDLNHSGFFSREFYEAAWLPLWADPNSEPARLAAERPPSPTIVRMVGVIPIKWVFLAAIAFLLLVVLFRH